MGTPLQLEVGARHGEKMPELLSPGKRFLPSIWGWQGGAHATALLSTGSLGLEEDTHKGNERLQLLQEQL